MTWQCPFLLKYLRYVVLFIRYFISTGTHNINLNLIKHKHETEHTHQMYIITIWANFEKTWKYGNDIILWRKKIIKMSFYTSHLSLTTDCAIFHFNQHLTSHVSKTHDWNNQNMNSVFVIFKKAKHQFHNVDIGKNIICMHWNFRLHWIDCENITT